MSRTAEEWGRLAVAIPGFAWAAGMRNGYAFKGGRVCRTVEAERETWVESLRQAGGLWSELFDDSWPDPDDPATAGCLFDLLGPGVRVWMDGDDGLWTAEVGGVRASMHATLGRSCIAAAEALGRWPGGGA